jgi:hypothetical protein
MTSRAELLAALEEKRWENNNVEQLVDGFSLEGPDSSGYDPYDNPGLGKEIPDGVDIAAHRRKRARRGRRR